jgi:NADPH:quinone reductase-like Zn-dependent oxidoreductase
MWTVELQGIGMDALAEVEKPLPEPGDGQLLVRLSSASINYRDLAMIRGDYGSGLQFPLVPLTDGAGVVVSVGEGVTRYQPGDRVIFTMRPEWIAGDPTREQIGLSLGMTLPGVFSEYRVANEDAVVRTPSHLSDEQAASLPIAALTAWTALVDNGHLAEGETIVIQGTGGVSIFALQFAKQLGARTIVLSSSDDKLDRVRALGADHVINYRTNPDWHLEVVRLTGGRGADHVLDIGGAATITRSLEAIRPGGHVYLIGFLGGHEITVDLPLVFRRLAKLHGLSVGSRASFEAMNAAIEEWKLEPVIDRTFQRHELVDALRYMDSGAQFGKIALKMTA